MKSLRDLNQTSLLQVTFEDDRPSGVEFYPDPPQATIFVDITENSEFYPDTGTNVISVVDFANARVKYKLDFSSWPVPVTVDWEDVAPDHPTISFSEISSNVWEIEGIDSDSVWNVVKSPVVYSPFGLSGVYTFVSTISYYAADGVTLLTKTWNTQVDILDVTYMSEPVQQHYVPYAIGDAIPAPSVVVDLVVFNPTFTLNISASNLDSVEAIRVTGNDSAVFTSTTDTLTIVGEKDEINDALATLEIDFAGVNENFVLTYRLTNDLNSNVEIVTQDFESDGELASGFTVQTTLVTEPVVFHIVRGASATVAEFSNRASLQYVFVGAADVQSDFEVVPNESVEWHGKPVAQQVEAIIPTVRYYRIRDASCDIDVRLSVEPNASVPAMFTFTTTGINREVPVAAGVILADEGTYDAYTGLITYTTNGGLEINWGDGTVETNPDFIAPGNDFGGAIYHTYSSPGTYTITVSVPGGSTPPTNISGPGSGISHTIDRWGDMIHPQDWQGDKNPIAIISGYATDCPSNIPRHWTFLSSLVGVSGGLGPTILNKIRLWDMSNITNTTRMFADVVFADPTISFDLWDTSNVTNMASMFLRSNFNGYIGNWDTSNVTNMGGMFNDATSFNQLIDSWDTSSVTAMSSMFYNADSFNQPLSSWDTSSVTAMRSMFERNFSFDQDISNWDVSNVTDSTDFDTDSNPNWTAAEKPNFT